MESIVLYKVVYIDEDENICFCDNEFRKTCATRIANNLPCQEMVVRFVPIDRENSIARRGESVGVSELDRRLENVKTEFLKTLKHLNRMI